MLGLKFYKLCPILFYIAENFSGWNGPFVILICWILSEKEISDNFYSIWKFLQNREKNLLVGLQLVRLTFRNSVRWDLYARVLFACDLIPNKHNQYQPFYYTDVTLQHHWISLILHVNNKIRFPHIPLADSLQLFSCL